METETKVLLIPQYQEEKDEFGTEIYVNRIQNIQQKKIVEILEDQGFKIVFI